MFDWGALGSALLGAVVGGGFALYAGHRAHERDLAKAELARRQKVRSVLQALRDELDVIWSRYNETMGKQIEDAPEGEPFLTDYKFGHDYFSVYHGNTHLIGEIEDEKLRKHIIGTYTQAKGLLDTITVQNQLSRFLWEEGKKRGQDWDDNRVASLKEALTIQLPALKRDHKKMKGIFGDTRTLLESEIRRLSE